MVDWSNRKNRSSRKTWKNRRRGRNPSKAFKGIHKISGLDFSSFQFISYPFSFRGHCFMEEFHLFLEPLEFQVQRLIPVGFNILSTLVVWMRFFVNRIIRSICHYSTLPRSFSDKRCPPCLVGEQIFPSWRSSPV